MTLDEFLQIVHFLFLFDILRVFPNLDYNAYKMPYIFVHV